MTDGETGGAVALRPAVTVLPGDGIGPEVMAAVIAVLEAAGARVTWEHHAAGRQVMEAGEVTGLPAETLESIRRTRAVLKGPLETPIGFGGKSANVTLRKLFETYANVRPVRSLPGVTTPFSDRGIDMVIVRENVEDLYAGIEHMQTPSVAQCLKLVSWKGCEKVIRLAFELAVAEGRRRVTGVTKANIMKLTEGMFQRVFEAVAKEYPDIEADHLLVDNAAHQLVRRPETFDVLVTTNLNGDILSDLASGLVGGLGIASGANLGADVSIFEAVHGSAPDIAGQDKANPTALLLSATMMMRHLGQPGVADRVEAALEATLAEGLHTGDLGGAGALGTRAFAEAIVARLPAVAVPRRRVKPLVVPRGDPRPDTVRPASRRTVGVDVFVEAALGAEELGRALDWLAEGSPLQLKMISNRGTTVYPPNGALTDMTDHWRCRFVARDPAGRIDDGAILGLLQRVGSRWRWMHCEKLEELDGVAGWTRAQGETAAIPPR